MAKVDEVKSKLLGLIATADAATGENSGDLTEAFLNLLAPYPSAAEAAKAAAESEANAKASEEIAVESAANAKTSETNAKTSETNAKASETAAGTAATKATSAAAEAKGVVADLNANDTPENRLLAENRNLFDGYTIPLSNISSSDGSIVASSAYRVTSFIKVNPSAVYTFFGWLIIGYYDADRGFLSRGYVTSGGARGTLTMPATCEWIRVSTSITATNQQIYEGDVDASKNLYEHPRIDDAYMPECYVRAENRTRNLFDGEVFEGTNIDDSTGLEKASEVYRTSNYIAVEPGTSYTPYKWLKVAFYTKDRVFISAKSISSNTAFTTPSGCYYVRLATSITSREQMLLYGTHSFFYYEKLKNTIPAEMVYKPRWKDKTYFFDKISGYYVAPEQETWNPTSRNVNDIYGIYDELMAANPNYIMKTDMGMDQNGSYHIYRYDFIPETPTAPDVAKHLPKVIIFSGVHGMERWSVYAIAQLMKLICTNPRKDAVLDYYRNGIHFIVVPLVNPWGYVNSTRWNSRGVNINRNFLTGWTVSGNAAFSNDYEGTAATSENETAIVDRILVENLDAFAVIDAHTHGITSWGDTYWHVATMDAECYEDVVSFSKSNIVRLTKSIKENHGLTFDGFAGYAEYGVPRGALQNRASYGLGLTAMTAEVTDKLVGESASGSALTNQINVEFYANLIASIIKYYQ